MYNVILACIIYIIFGIGAAKSISRAIPEFTDGGSRFVLTLLWPLAIVCMTIFADWD